MVSPVCGQAGLDPAWLSQAVGRPVRVQGMRYEGHAWDVETPEALALEYVADHRAIARARWIEAGPLGIDTNESDPVYSLAGQLTGLPLRSLQGFGVPAESYGFASKRLAWETVAPLLDLAGAAANLKKVNPTAPMFQLSARTGRASATGTGGGASNWPRHAKRHLPKPGFVAGWRPAAQSPASLTRPQSLTACHAIAGRDQWAGATAIERGRPIQWAAWRGRESGCRGH